MQDLAYWIFLGLMVFFLIVFVFWHKRNRHLLTEEERQKMSQKLAEASSRELRYIWILIAFCAVLFLIQKLFGMPLVVFGVMTVISLIYGVFRNIWIYRKENLPARFIKSESYLGIITCSFMTVMTFWAYWH